MKNQAKIDYEVTRMVLENLKGQLQIIRDLKAHSKSTTKGRLTKIEKHLALSKQLTEELVEKYGSKQKDK